jgi:serine/threonine-protein kinase
VPADLIEGQNLGRYRVLEPLGRGGMARVYRAYHAQLDRYVAIKVLRSDLLDDEEFLARFKREARAVAALRHPNIVQVFDFDVQGDLYYMVMELLDGDTLGARLADYRARGERMPWGEMVRILLDVLDALGYAHGEGMIHRDVKPANVLLSRRGQAVLGDFGIAQIVGGTRHTLSGALMGTLSYMAPEQGLEGQCDARSDLYSLGIVFYEMLLGDPPFDAETPLAILMKHVNDPLPLPRQQDPSIPVPFERVVLKALAKRPGDRYQSASEMTEALCRAALDAGVDVPGRVSLPLSFTTPAAPSESVAVLSGSARQRVADPGFAAGDTDASLSEKLAAEMSATPAVAGAAAAVVATATSEAETAENVDAEREARHARRRERREAKAAVRHPRSMAIPEVAIIIGVYNLAAVMFGAITGNWGLFSRGWPIELLLAGLLLLEVMDASGSIWLLIPVGIVLGNGYLFSFYAITGFWGLWTLLWPLEPLLILVSILTPFRLVDDEEQGERLAHRLAAGLRRPTQIAIGVVIVLAALIGWMAR